VLPVHWYPYGIVIPCSREAREMKQWIMPLKSDPFFSHIFPGSLSPLAISCAGIRADPDKEVAPPRKRSTGMPFPFILKISSGGAEWRYIDGCHNRPRFLWSSSRRSGRRRFDRQVHDDIGPFLAELLVGEDVTFTYRSPLPPATRAFSQPAIRIACRSRYPAV